MNDGPNSGTDPQKLLVVDDHAAFRQTIRAFLPREGVEVTECATGRQALERYGDLRPDWVLMDIEMPGLDGLAALRQLKARFPEARVVIVTQYNDPEFRATAHTLGAVGYVLKEHLEQLRDILSGKGGTPQSPSTPRSTQPSTIDTSL